MPCIGQLAGFAQGLRRPFKVHGIPQHDGGRQQVQSTGAVALLLEAPVADLAESLDADRPGQGVARLALVEPGMYALAQFDVL